jgi:hypothetical protein
MFLAAIVATRRDPHARAYYQRKREEGKNHNAAVICVARRRCDLISPCCKQQPPTTSTTKKNHRKPLDNETGTPCFLRHLLLFSAPRPRASNTVAIVRREGFPGSLMRYDVGGKGIHGYQH